MIKHLILLFLDTFCSFAKHLIEEARDVLQKHTDHCKWAVSAFSTEQLKGQRWMVGSSPKNCPAALKKALSVTDQAQVMHFRLVIQCYHEAGRRLKASSRPRVRWSQEQFDLHCDLACVYSAILDEARALSSWDQEKEAAVMKAFFQKISSCNSPDFVFFCFLLKECFWDVPTYFSTFRQLLSKQI